MSSYDSYLFNHQLPDNETYKMIHNILAICNSVAFGCCYAIMYLSPPSKESNYYKLLVHSQGVFTFLFSLLWSLLLKFMFHLNFKFFYCEGYCHLVGLTCANGYTLLCFVFGTYGFTIVCSYLFRLYLIVDHTHYLRTPNVFPVICVVFEFFTAFVTSLTFHIGYSEFDPHSLPFNLTHEQLDYMSTRTVSSYTMKTVKEMFYPVYFVFLIVLVFVVVLFTACEIVRNIHKKQSLMSTGASTHHLKVLKILTIQVTSNILLSCCAPITIALSLFLDLHSSLVYACALLMGTNSLVQSVLMICLNPVFRKTVLTLFVFHKPETRKVTVRVDPERKS